jgi:hypothetical protein
VAAWKARLEQVRRERGLGLSEALNEVARAGLSRQPREPDRVRLETRSLGLRIDVSNIAEALDVAEETPDR